MPLTKAWGISLTFGLDSIALPHQDNGFTIIVAQEWLVLGKCVYGHVRLEIGSG
jgi:hypothetical protein